MPPPSSPFPLLTALAGGTLASSCCLIQLALNSLGFGCAGFAALDPLRPAALAATAVLLAVAHARHRSWRRTGTAIVFATVIASSPEWTEAVGRAGGVARWLAVGRAAPPPLALDFLLTGVKCAACGERARATAAAAHADVSRARVAWREGRVRVEGRGGAGLVDAVTASLEGAGFGVDRVEAVRLVEGWRDEV
jgi:hypothetical protein